MIVDSVAIESENHNGFYIPPITNCQKKIHITIDNLDFHYDTPLGKNEFDSTIQVALKKVTKSKVSSIRIESLQSYI